MNNTLIIIPARKGSKGLPNKNVKNLGGKPLIQHTIEFAKEISTKDDLICVSTDSEQIIDLCRSLKINIDFKRPSPLASDNASMDEVILHAINFYGQSSFKYVLLLQPTTPFRQKEDYLKMRKALLSTDDGIEQVASVKIVKDNPYFNMFLTNEEGCIEKIIKNELVTNRQECPKIIALNGSMYFFKKEVFLKKKSLKALKTKPYLMSTYNSCDIDTMDDFVYAQFLIQMNFYA